MSMHSPQKPYIIIDQSDKKMGQFVVREARTKARQTMGMSDNKYNIGIVGTSGSGKSSLINGLLGISDNHQNAAKVGEVETTNIASPHIHPTKPQIVLWDVPGAGTHSHPINDYFEKSKLFAFDCLVVVMERVTETEHRIFDAWYTDHPFVPAIPVRNKADRDLVSKQKRFPHKSQTDLKDEIRNELNQEMSHSNAMRYGAITRFVVSAYAFLDPAVPNMDEVSLKNHLEFLGDEYFKRIKLN